MAKGIKDELYSIESQTLDLQEFREKLAQCLSDVEDPRAFDNQTYHFESLIGIVLCAIIAGANGVSDIYNYAVSKQKWLSEWLNLSSGLPSYIVLVVVSKNGPCSM